MGALAWIEVGTRIIEEVTKLVQAWKDRAVADGVTPEQIAEAEQRGHAAAAKLTTKADAILARIGTI